MALNLEQLVFERAAFRCEYCHTQQLLVIVMQLDHIIPQSKGGPTTSENLCLACTTCNNHKSDHQTGIDPLTTFEHPLFNPRNDLWEAHFEWGADKAVLVGLTPIGRATIARLKINSDTVVKSRRFWVKLGVHPPQ